MKVAAAAAVACVPLLLAGLPDLLAAVLSGVLFLGVGQALGVVPRELRAALGGAR